jgi:hypothetical protein
MNTATLRSIPIAALALLLAVPAVAQHDVTFRVDMNTAIDHCRVVDGFTAISIPGAFNDWSPGAWLLTDDNDDGIFTGTFQIAAGTYEYKFYGHPEYLLGGWDSGDNRSVQVTGDMTLDVATFFRTFTDMCAADGQSNVTFRVDMSAAAENCAITDDSVISVPGSFNDWTAGATTLQHVGGNLYAGTHAITNGTIDFKFHGTPENRISWEDGGNIQAVVDADKLLGVAVFRKDGGFADWCEGVVEEDFQINFEVDMGVQVLSGAFNPDTDRVYVAGAAFGWGPGADNQMVRNPFAEEDWLFTISITRTLVVPSDNPYKFIFVNATDQVTWEDGADRIFSAAEDIPNNVINVPKRFFNDIGYDNILSAETVIKVVVDLRPAYYFLEDTGTLPADSQSGEIPNPSIDGLFVNGPFAHYAQGVTGGQWADWGPDALGANDTRRFYDDGTHGDATAGDMFYTRTYTYPAGTPRTVVGKFGINGYDNEAGFQLDQHVVLSEGQDVVVNIIFGCVRRQDGTYASHFNTDVDSPWHRAYAPYLVVDNTGDVPTCSVVRSGGHVVSNEPIGPASENIELVSYPNPAVNSATFEYSIPQAADVRLEVYDLMGRRVATLVDETQQASSYRVSFDTSGLANGTYIYRLAAGDSVLTRRMTVIR